MNRPSVSWGSFSKELDGIKRFLNTSTARLAASYLLVIMVMSLSFSIVSYNTSSRALGRQIPPTAYYDGNGVRRDPARLLSPQLNDFLQDRIDEGRHALLARFIMVNLLVLAAGAVLSYYLARRTLQPIEDSMEAQSQFISDASHELRTPLTAIQTTNEVTLRNKKLTLADARQALQQNVEEVVKLKALTDGLLKLARHEAAAEPVHEPVSLQDVASDAFNQVMPGALDKHIAIDDQTRQLMVFGDRQALTQALVILLDNAIKYSPAKSTVYIQTDKKSKQAILSVRDEGPGIRPYDLRKIFDRFYRADQSRSNQHVSGHGIGLALARKIVEQHGGEVSAVSAEGKGSTFSIKLPVAG